MIPPDILIQWIVNIGLILWASWHELQLKICSKCSYFLKSKDQVSLSNMELSNTLAEGSSSTNKSFSN
jgi:hypothetical protein